MQNPNNALFLFLKELVMRFSTKSPVFFKVFQVISGVFVLIVAVPEFLTMFNIQLPQVFNDGLQKVITGLSTGILFVSAMTSQSTPAGVDINGNVLKKTNDVKLPFTDAKEKKQLLKQDIVDEMVVAGKIDPKNY